MRHPHRHTPSSYAACLILALGLVAGACGGSSPAIQHRLDMKYVATTPPEERQAVSDAAEALYRAQVELDHAQFEADDIDYEIKKARAEKKQLDAQRDIDAIEEKRNENVFRVKLAEAAKRALSKDKGRGQTHKQRMKYLKARKKALAKRVSYARAHFHHSEAQLELAKARLAAKQNTLPKKGTLSKFEKQEAKTRAKAAKTLSKHKSAEQKSNTLKSEWKKASK